MGSPIEFSNEDLLRGEIVEPGWYTVKINSYEEAPSKNGDSTNYILNTVIVRNSGNGDEAFAGVPIKLNFNSKAKGFSIGFLKALGIGAESGQRYDLEQTVGEIVDVHITTGTYQDRPKNEVNHSYRPVVR